MPMIVGVLTAVSLLAAGCGVRWLRRPTTAAAGLKDVLHTKGSSTHSGAS